VVDAISRQTAVLNTHTRYLHTQIVDYAEALLASFPAPLSQVMFTCTGSEANDLAVRIAHAVTGGTGIIVTEHAYHGVTSAVSAFSHSLGAKIPAAPHVRTVPAPDAYRGSSAEVGAQLERAVRLAIADLADHGIRPAMFIVDTIFSSDGIFSEPAGFLGPAVAAIRQAGGLFVADGPGVARQTHGQRVSAGRAGGNRRSAREVQPGGALLQHLRRQSGCRGRRLRGARCHSR
jgi:4-aminobutyrate aminotransferase-like enzyme